MIHAPHQAGYIGDWGLLRTYQGPPGGGGHQGAPRGSEGAPRGSDWAPGGSKGAPGEYIMAIKAGQYRAEKVEGGGDMGGEEGGEYEDVEDTMMRPDTPYFRQKFNHAVILSSNYVLTKS